MKEQKLNTKKRNRKRPDIDSKANIDENQSLEIPFVRRFILYDRVYGVQ